MFDHAAVGTIPLSCCRRRRARQAPADFPTQVQWKGKEVEQQTIVWRVLMAWKGPLGHGERFITRMRYGLDECTSQFPVHERTAQFFYGYGKSPFLDFDVNADLSHAEDDFLFLAEIRSR